MDACGTHWWCGKNCLDLSQSISFIVLPFSAPSCDTTSTNLHILMQSAYYFLYALYKKTFKKTQYFFVWWVLSTHPSIHIELKTTIQDLWLVNQRITCCCCFADRKFHPHSPTETLQSIQKNNSRRLSQPRQEAAKMDIKCYTQNDKAGLASA